MLLIYSILDIFKADMINLIKFVFSHFLLFYMHLYLLWTWTDCSGKYLVYVIIGFLTVSEKAFKSKLNS